MTQRDDSSGRQDLELSGHAVAVLKMIATGHTYEQILATHPGLTYLDIFAAASEAIDGHREDAESAVHRVKRVHPRAYERWTPKEEAELRALRAAGRSVAEIAGELQRQPSAIRSRMSHLGFDQDDDGAGSGPR